MQATQSRLLESLPQSRGQQPEVSSAAHSAQRGTASSGIPPALSSQLAQAQDTRQSAGDSNLLAEQHKFSAWTHASCTSQCQGMPAASLVTSLRLQAAMTPLSMLQVPRCQSTTRPLAKRWTWINSRGSPCQHWGVHRGVPHNVVHVCIALLKNQREFKQSMAISALLWTCHWYYLPAKARCQQQGDLLLTQMSDVTCPALDEGNCDAYLMAPLSEPRTRHDALKSC